MASRASSSATSAAALIVGDSGNPLQTYRLNEKLRLTVAQGSVVDFASKNGAIVNAANEGCLGGGGVDGAITDAGGDNLADDRLKLPVLRGGIRCPTGCAKLTGPGNYGSLKVPFVVHAVGPNYLYFDEENDVKTPNRLLRSAYKSALDCCILVEQTTSPPPSPSPPPPVIKHVAFALLSAGVFRGQQSLSAVLGIGVKAIRDWSQDEGQTSLESNHLEDIVLYAFTDREARTLVAVCDKFLEPSSPRPTSPDTSPEKEEIHKNQAVDSDNKKEEAKPLSSLSPDEKVEQLDSANGEDATSPDQKKQIETNDDKNNNEEPDAKSPEVELDQVCANQQDEDLPASKTDDEDKSPPKKIRKENAEATNVGDAEMKDSKQGNLPESNGLTDNEEKSTPTKIKNESKETTNGGDEEMKDTEQDKSPKE